eukprot:155951-Pelagomonas_calceolata.AAC.2
MSMLRQTKEESFCLSEETGVGIYVHVASNKGKVLVSEARVAALGHKQVQGSHGRLEWALMPMLRKVRRVG